MVSGPSLTLRGGDCSGGRCSTAQSVYRMVLRFVFLHGTYALHGEQRVLGTPVALFANAAFLAPQVAINGITLRHFVVAEALLKAHPSAVAELAQQAQHLPLDIRGRLLGGVAEINFVLDLEPAQLRLKKNQFFVDSHREFSNHSVGRSEQAGEVPIGHRRDGTKVTEGSFFWLLALAQPSELAELDCSS